MGQKLLNRKERRKGGGRKKGETMEGRKKERREEGKKAEIYTETWGGQDKATIKLSDLGDFPGGPVGKTPCSQCRGHGFDPWLGNWIPHACSN